MRRGYLMSGRTEEQMSFENLMPLLDEHAEWYGRVMRRIFYPEKYEKGSLLHAPEAIKKWLRTMDEKGQIDSESLNDIRKTLDDFHRVALDMIREAADAEGKPAVARYDTLVSLYESFIARMRRLEHDMMHAGSIDEQSGLRNVEAMRRDVAREQERRARRGQPFCLMLCRVDRFDDLSEKRSDQIDALLKSIASFVKQSIRTFDDAYHMGDGEFIVVLKNSDMINSPAIIERMRKFLRGEDGVTMSYCSAEPMPGDSIDDLIDNMRIDLNRYDEGGNTVLEFVEQSPLQRFVQSDKGK